MSFMQLQKSAKCVALQAVGFAKKKKKTQNKPLVIRAFLFSLKKPKCFETFEFETRFRVVTSISMVWELLLGEPLN